MVLGRRKRCIQGTAGWLPRSQSQAVLCTCQADDRLLIAGRGSRTYTNTYSLCAGTCAASSAAISNEGLIMENSLFLQPIQLLLHGSNLLVRFL